MKKHARFINAPRRGFLQGAAVAGGTVVAGAASGTALEPAVDVAEPAPLEARESRGYRKTEHVRRYYDRARF